MKNEMYKDFLDGLRNQKFLILSIGFMFMSIMTPLMMRYILPELLYKEMMNLTDEEILNLINFSQMGVLTSFSNDLYEFGILFLAFALGSLIPVEIKSHHLIFFKTSQKKYQAMIFSKWIVYTCFILLINCISFLIDYLYAGLLFSFSTNLSTILWSSLLYGLFWSMIVSLILWVGTITKNALGTGLIVFLGTLIIGSILNLTAIKHYTPFELINIAQKFLSINTTTLIIPASVTIIVTLIMIYHTIHMMNKIEISSYRGNDHVT
jgi:ABC-2 type transport system permease protein